ncbi:hypothetical protein ABIB35_000811 [Arthrobacter sp. UYP6]|uniref:hypothetical protein n=1 Tax=Arthrobacter sp. UYP6 TaxID=1756378 RepID=UPI0033990FF9
MPISEPPELIPPRAQKPVTTWVLMICALISLLLIPDWTGSGRIRPLWLFGIPVGMGLMGAVFAAHSGRFGWAMLSAFWGFFLAQGLIAGITLIDGP